MAEPSQIYELFWLIIPKLISLSFIAGMFKAYSLRNEKMGDILVASNIWVFILLGQVGILTLNYLDTTQKIFMIFSSPFLYINLFLFGGILAKTYFSKYYGKIILKIGIVISLSVHLVIHPLIRMYLLRNFDVSIFDILNINFFIGNIMYLLFIVPYFKLISNTNINVTITSNNDPKDW